MIVTFILTILYSFINLLLGILPTGHIPAGFTNAFAYFMGLVNAYSYVVPIGTLLAAAAVVLVFDGALMLWYFINWIIRKIPGMN